MPRSENELRIQDLKIQVFGLLRRLEVGLTAAADTERATVEALDERARRAYLALESAPDGDAYVILTEALRDLLAMGLEGRPPGRGRMVRGAEGGVRRAPGDRV